MKKRIILSICSLCLVVCACFGFSACKKKNTNLVFGANYKFSTISLMGFTGDRNSISEYLEDQQSIEDNNFIKNYFDLVKNLEVKFNENGTGSIILTNNPGFPSLDDVVDENGNANFSFTYTKDADTITITKVDTGEKFGGEMTIAEVLNKIIGHEVDSHTDEQIFSEYKVSEDAKNLKLDNGNVVMNLYIQYKMNSTNPGSDIETTVSVVFAR